MDARQKTELSLVIAQNLERECREKGMTYQEVIEKAEIASSTMYEILSGKSNPRIQTLENISRALKISMIDLIADQNSDISEL